MKTTLKNVLRGLLWSFIVMIMITTIDYFWEWDMDFLNGWISCIAFAHGARYFK